jgi:hypothetical protein
MKTFFKITNKSISLVAILYLLLLIPIEIYAQKQQRSFGEFYKISFATGGYLEINQGDTQLVELEGPQSVLDQIITVVDNGRLRIYTKNYIKQFGDLKVYITVKNLSDITVSGSGDVVMNTSLKTENLNLEITGSGNIRMPDLKSIHTELQIAGSGDIMVKGISEEKVDINITGSGDIKASDLQTKHVDINITGSGSAEIFATDKLEGNIVGSGNIYYKGEPILDAKSTGSGKVRPLK